MNRITKDQPSHVSQHSSNEMLGVVLINGQKDFFEKEDGVRSWYKCPNCGDENVRWKNIYCEACSCEFEWSGHYT